MNYKQSGKFYLDSNYHFFSGVVTSGYTDLTVLISLPAGNYVFTAIVAGAVGRAARLSLSLVEVRRTPLNLMVVG